MVPWSVLVIFMATAASVLSMGQYVTGQILTPVVATGWETVNKGVWLSFVNLRDGIKMRLHLTYSITNSYSQLEKIKITTM